MKNKKYPFGASYWLAQTENLVNLKENYINHCKHFSIYTILSQCQRNLKSYHINHQHYYPEPTSFLLSNFLNGAIKRLIILLDVNCNDLLFAYATTVKQNPSFQIDQRFRSVHLTKLHGNKISRSFRNLQSKKNKLKQ